MTLVVDGMTAGYGAIVALRSVSFECPPGTVTAVLGPNGAGKSTLVRCLAGVHPCEGTVSADGATLRPLRPRDRKRAGVATVSDGRDLVPTLTVDRYLALILDAAGRERAYELFPPLAPLAGQRCGVLSGGESQMLALARALALQPRVLILDEISQGLAPTIIARLMPVVRASANVGVCVVLVEQHARMACAFADRVVLLDRGSVRYVGGTTDAPIDEVFALSVE